MGGVHAVFFPDVINTKAPQGSTFFPVLFFNLKFSGDKAIVALIKEDCTRCCGWTDLLVGLCQHSFKTNLSWKFVNMKKIILLHFLLNNPTSNTNKYSHEGRTMSLNNNFKGQ